MQFTQIVTLLHQVLQKKLKYFEKVFHGFNNYREYVIKQILKQVQMSKTNKMLRFQQQP